MAIAAGLVAAGDTQRAPAAPRLVVVISVDQWAYQYFQRFAGNFPRNGFVNRVQSEGAWYSECHHGHAFTYTAPGHAVLLTGAYPERTGIVDNEWFDRVTDKEVYCVADQDATLVGAIVTDAPVSPRPLLAETVGDRLKYATQGKAKVFGVAIKDRASILMVGRQGDAAFWMSADGQWITSSFYRPNIPPYLRLFNEQKVNASYARREWQLMLPHDQYVHGVTEDSFGERPVNGVTADFPHVLAEAADASFIKQLACSPFGNEIALRTALLVAIEEQLGQDDDPDLLVINLSSNDYVGHSFGPDSLEAEDMTYRTDRLLEAFRQRIDEQLKGAAWTIYVTADHGICPIPERIQRQHGSAGRDPFGAVDERGNYEQLRAAMENHLRRQLAVTASPRNLIQAVTDNQVYLAGEHPELVGARYDLAQQICRDWLLRSELIGAAFTRHDLSAISETGEGLENAFRRSFHAGRCGEILFAKKPFFINGTAGTTHGSPWNYDTHVPLMIWEHSASTGPKIARGVFFERVSPAAIAPTIARQLGIDPPAECQVAPLRMSE
jgi:predicted AlkP superfamily pyrophosphatase or phosphodiesterase